MFSPYAIIVAAWRKLNTFKKIRFKPRIGKRLRKMAKNQSKRGHSVRNGNTPSCYQKFNKKPYKYTFPGAYSKVGGGPKADKYANERGR